MKRLLLALLLVIPTIVGAFFLPTPPEQEQQTAGQLSGIDAALLVDARRATSDASSQAGFLVAGAAELAAGTAQLQEKTGEMTDGVAKIHDGAKQLQDGLIQLQAGTGQMGTGATEIADGVENAVAQVQGLTMLQMQIAGALDNADKELAKIQDPAIPGLRKQLGDIKAEAAKLGITGDTADKLDKLRTGTRELANQLAVPGYGFHDGIYEATKGSKQLADATGELAAGTTAATEGIGKLNDGAAKVDQMATLTKEKVGAIGKALPVGVNQTAAAVDDAQPQGPAPIVAFFLLALVTAGALLGAGRWWIGVVGAAMAGIVGLWAVNATSNQTAFAVAAIAMVLTAMASGAVAMALRQIAGVAAGRAIASGLLVLQVAVVARALQDGGSQVLSVAAKLMPLQYPLAMIEQYNNNMVVLVTCAVLGSLVVLGALLGRFVRQRPSASTANTGIAATAATAATTAATATEPANFYED